MHHGLYFDNVYSISTPLATKQKADTSELSDLRSALASTSLTAIQKNLKPNRRKTNHIGEHIYTT